MDKKDQQDERLRLIDGMDEDEFFDECLRQALEEDLQREMEEIEAELENEPPHRFSRDFEKRMAKLFGMPLWKFRWQQWKYDREHGVKRKRPPHPGGSSCLVRVATLLAVFLAGGITFSALNPEVRASFSQFVVQMFGDHNKIQTPDSDVFVSVGMKYCMMYTPNGYKLADVYEKDSRSTYVFQGSSDDQEFILVFKAGIIDSSELGYDIDYTEEEVQDINEVTGRLFKTSQGQTALLWNIGTDSFLIVGTMDKAEIVKTAENIIVQN